MNNQKRKSENEKIDGYGIILAGIVGLIIFLDFAASQLVQPTFYLNASLFPLISQNNTSLFRLIPQNTTFFGNVKPNGTECISSLKEQKTFNYTTQQYTDTTITNASQIRNIYAENNAKFVSQTKGNIIQIPSGYTLLCPNISGYK